MGCASVFDLSRAGSDLSKCCDEDLHANQFVASASLRLHEDENARAEANEEPGPTVKCLRPFLVVLLQGGEEPVFVATVNNPL